MKLLKDFGLIILSSLLLILSLPDFNLGFFAWFGLVPILIAIHGKDLKYAFLLSFTCGIFFFAGVFYWIVEVQGYKPIIHHTLLGIYLGPFFGLWGMVFVFISRRWGTTPALLAAPFIWVSFEYIRSNLDFLALPWGLLAHSQYQYPVVMQIASITGAYGLSFLIVMVNAAIAGMLLRGKYRLKIPPSLPLPKGEKDKGNLTTLQKPGEIHPPLKKRDRGGFVYQISLPVIAVSLLLFTLIYGYLTITTPIIGNQVKISLVQGNIEQNKKWDPRFAKEIMQIYSELTDEVSKDKPALIIWPETATPGSITQNPWIHMEVGKIVKNTGTALLFGSAQHQKFKEKEAQKYKYSNSAYLIGPETPPGKNQRYDKIRLFPFGEYLPYKEVIPWSLVKVSGLDNYWAGNEFTVFQHPDFRFGVTICWENVFPDLVRQFVKRGAQCIINLTNEAHFGKTAAPHQLVSISVLRAIENRVYVVRCANTGVSCIIDPYGRILDRVKDEKDNDTFIRGTITGSIIPLESRTIYTQYGDWLVWVAIVGSLAFLVVSFLKKRNKITAALRHGKTATLCFSYEHA